MKICAVVVTYYPDPEEAKHNILEYIEYVDHLIVWENTPSQDIQNHKINLEEFEDNVSFLSTGENMGISYALNEAIQYARDHEFTHMLTMDQDSRWINFYDYITGIELNGLQGCLVGPRVTIDFKANKIQPSYKEVEYIITSGMIIPVSEVQRIGGYEQEFIVDGIDTELCLRAINHGLKVIEADFGQLVQRFGNKKKATFLGVPFNTSGYSPFRLYGITRNHIIILRKYKTSFKLKKAIIKRFILSFSLRILLGEHQKHEKLKALWKGVYDGMTYKI